MNSPYTPPQAQSPAPVRRGASRGDRIAVRILGVLAVLTAIRLGTLLPRHEVGVLGLDSGSFESSSHKLLAMLLLSQEGAIPFIAAVLLAGIGLFLSFRAQARTRAMLAFVCASFLLTMAALFGNWFLIGEFVRATGGI